MTVPAVAAKPVACSASAETGVLVSQILPVSIGRLLEGSSVESERIEFKASWEPATTGHQVLKTICAFANDYHNLNGGYIVIGVRERGGRAILPPCGVDPEQIEAAQRWIRGQCNRFVPDYHPILSPEVMNGRHVLVVWVPASDMRPHQAPDGDAGGRKFWIRLGSETIDTSKKGMVRTLVEQSSRVAWDERQATDASIADMRESKVREYLRDVDSGLFDEPSLPDVYRRMRLTRKINDHEIPRNVGLLLFSEDPTLWYPGARIEVAQFADGTAGDVQEEHVFGGTLTEQVRSCLRHLQSLSGTHVIKRPDQPQVQGWVSYPLRAVRESLVNAIYHRSYQPSVPTPTKVYLYPSHMEIISYPGPVPGVEREHFLPRARIPPVPARNQRIGEFLKELKLAEGRLTGLRKVFKDLEANGSAPPGFDFDDNRSYFRVTLPAHPEYSAIIALRDAAQLRALGGRNNAVLRIEGAWEANPGSGVLATELIRLFSDRGNLGKAEQVFDEFKRHGSTAALPHVANTLIESLLDAGLSKKARVILNELPEVTRGQDAINSAIMARRLKDLRRAHYYFEQAGDLVNSDPRSMHEFAQAKLDSARKACRDRDRITNRKLLSESRQLLERVLQYEAPPIRHAWAWRDLARTLYWQRESFGSVEEAYEQAIHLLPEETRFVRELKELREQQAACPTRANHRANGRKRR